MDGKTFWSKGGYSDVLHAHDKAAKQANSQAHISYDVALKTFGKIKRVIQLTEQTRDISRHNPNVDKNRYVLRTIIDALVFCGSHETGLRGHDETPDSINK